MAVADRLDEIVGDIIADLPGAGVADIRRELARKCKEFCELSRVWRIKCAVNHIQGGERIVRLQNATSGARVVTLDQVWYNRGIAARSDLGWRLGVGEDGSDVIVFSRCPSPEDEWSIRFRASLMPKTDFLMPEWIYEKYGEYLAAGVISRMKRRIGRNYTDIEGAQLFDADWRRGVGYAAIEATGENTSVNSAPIVPGGSSWTVEDGDINRTAAAVPEYQQLLAAFRTLVSDLVERGYLPEGTSI